jgi:prepilin-type N-terminal cleavage/methylation domain-containing protein
MKKLSASSYQLLACREEGFSLIEVMLAMVILAFAVVGVMGMYHWADYGLRLGTNGIRALALAESRLEAKRAAPWDGLLADDLDFDGRPDLTMRDDGTGPDEKAGDGVYSAAADDGAIHLVWTVQTDRPGPLRLAGSVSILVRASFPAGKGPRREIRIGTLRANPRYVGAR